MLPPRDAHREIITQLWQMITAVLLDHTLHFLVIVSQRLVAPPLPQIAILIVPAT